ncbi:hypothetical protein QAD02_022786 [Eretmocerus hayati]|uniref:Uncharacterized protein n=1 Tax=Eretmocerus hayati TaxID=131215 RepID=A0ACC2PU76_9HYME|nr:hypothetical protein QAD02_022786 [Eretmocerus hayati]
MSQNDTAGCSGFPTSDCEGHQMFHPGATCQTFLSPDLRCLGLPLKARAVSWVVVFRDALIARVTRTGQAMGTIAKSPRSEGLPAVVIKAVATVGVKFRQPRIIVEAVSLVTAGVRLPVVNMGPATVTLVDIRVHAVGTI